MPPLPFIPPFPVTDFNASRAANEYVFTVLPLVTVSTTGPVAVVDVLQDESNIAATINRAKPNHVTFFIIFSPLFY
jgi:hypothetical protein